MTPRSFEEGRYVFCAVRLDHQPSRTLEIDGIEEGAITILEVDGIGLLLQPVESVFDSDDATRVRRWLLDHHRVVEAAGERFGTPLPFRFDTIFTGNDGLVREWLEANHDTIEEHLLLLSDRWEYRITLLWEPERIRSHIIDTDPELGSLDRKSNDESGMAYLQKKQFDRQLELKLAQKRDSIMSDILEEVDEYIIDLRSSDDPPSEDRLEPVGSLSILAAEANEDSIGSVLESIADEYGLEVRYTGPWPPYSFAPALGIDGNEAE